MTPTKAPKSKRPRDNNSTDSAKPIQAVSLERRMDMLENRVEIIDRTSKRRSAWLFNVNVEEAQLRLDISMADKRARVRQLARTAFAMPDDMSNSLNIDWVGVFMVPPLADKPRLARVKIEFATLQDKEELSSRAKNLANYNKARKPPLIYADDMTPKQRQEAKEKRAAKRNPWAVLFFRFLARWFWIRFLKIQSIYYSSGRISSILFISNCLLFSIRLCKFSHIYNRLYTQRVVICFLFLHLKLVVLHVNNINW